MADDCGGDYRAPSGRIVTQFLYTMTQYTTMLAVDDAAHYAMACGGLAKDAQFDVLSGLLDGFRRSRRTQLLAKKCLDLFQHLRAGHGIRQPVILARKFDQAHLLACRLQLRRHAS